MVALDVESVSPQLDDVADVDFLDSRQFEMLCVGVGYRLTSDSPPETGGNTSRIPPTTAPTRSSNSWPPGTGRTPTGRTT